MRVDDGRGEYLVTGNPDKSVRETTLVTLSTTNVCRTEPDVLSISIRLRAKS